MRIALNLIGYSPGSGGVETYLLNLLAALQEVDRKNQYIVLCDEVAAPFLPLNNDNFLIKTVAYQKYSLKGMIRGLLQRVTGIDVLVRELAGLAVDVMHHPLTVLNPPGLPYPSVLTFHDMQQEFFPEFFSEDELRRRRRNYRTSVQEASVVITVSAHAAQCLVERYGIEPTKIQVVHSGCGKEFHQTGPDKLGEIVAEYHLNRPFMIYPAATWLHKNHSRLLEAVRLLIDQGAFDGELLLFGAEMEAHRELLAAVKLLDLSSHVRWLGYLPQDRIPGMFNLARLMVFPSLFEGFGLPVVEAMACGCPVICSASSSLPEIAGDAAVYCDPLQVADISEKIRRVWNDELLRTELKSRGLLRASHFSWQKAAEETVAMYYRAAQNGASHVP